MQNMIIILYYEIQAQIYLNTQILLIKMNRNVMGNITPRVVNYRNNGTSRDTYVSYNCGGYHV